MPELIFTDEDDRRVAAIVARTTGYVEQRFDELADALPADVHSELLDAARAYIGRYVDCNLAVRAVVDRLVSRFGGEFPDLGATVVPACARTS
jgi:hypothetical protein